MNAAHYSSHTYTCSHASDRDSRSTFTLRPSIMHRVCVCVCTVHPSIHPSSHRAIHNTIIADLFDYYIHDRCVRARACAHSHKVYDLVLATKRAQTRRPNTKCDNARPLAHCASTRKRIVCVRHKTSSSAAAVSLANDTRLLRSVRHEALFIIGIRSAEDDKTTAPAEAQSNAVIIDKCTRLPNGWHNALPCRFFKLQSRHMCSDRHVPELRRYAISHTCAIACVACGTAIVCGGVLLICIIQCTDYGTRCVTVVSNGNM